MRSLCDPAGSGNKPEEPSPRADGDGSADMDEKFLKVQRECQSLAAELRTAHLVIVPFGGSQASNRSIIEASGLYKDSKGNSIAGIYAVNVGRHF